MWVGTSTRTAVIQLESSFKPIGFKVLKVKVQKAPFPPSVFDEVNYQMLKLSQLNKTGDYSQHVRRWTNV